MARRMKCRPLAASGLFRFGDTNPNWDQAVDKFMAVQAVNRLCEHVNRRRPKSNTDPS